MCTKIMNNNRLMKNTVKILVLVGLCFLIFRPNPIFNRPIQEILVFEEAEEVQVAKSFVEGSSGQLFKGEAFRKFHASNQRFQGSQPTIPSQSVEKNKNCQGKHWAVLTTIFPPSEAVRRLRYTELCVVIVGDKNRPENGYTFRSSLGENLIFLDEKEQMQMNSAFVNGLKWNHFGRKNIGYLYAVANGAEVIWDFDDDNMFKFWMKNVSPTRELDFRTYIPENPLYDKLSVYIPRMLDNINPPVFNPYPLLGCDQSPCWPRGLPLTTIKDANHNTPQNMEVASIKWRKIGILQSLADYEPDVDAIFRFTARTPAFFNSSKSPDAQMSNAPKPLILPKGIFTPLNAQATFFYKPAFFALYLPITIHGRVTDIWRSYVAEALFALCDLRFGFLPKPLVVQDRNAHNLQGDFNSEIPLYTQSEVLVNFLSQWTEEMKTAKRSFFQLMELLWIELYERGYVEIEDVFSVQEWIRALHSIGYTFPTLNQGTNSVEDSSQTSVPSAVKYNVGKSVLQTESALIPPSCVNVPVKNFFLFAEATADITSQQPLMLASLNQQLVFGQPKDSQPKNNNPNIHINDKLSEIVQKLKNENPNYTKIQSDLNEMQDYKKADVFQCQYPDVFCDIIVPQGKAIVYISSSKYNQGQCSVESRVNLNLSNPNNILTGQSLYDVEYMKYYTGFEDIPQLEPFFSTQTSNVYKQESKNILIMQNSKPVYEQLKNIQPFELINVDENVDMSSLAAVVFTPNSMTSDNLTDFYSKGIPMFVPSPMVALTTDDTAHYCGSKNVQLAQAVGNTHPYSPNAQEAEAQLYWSQFVQFYSWPHITYFTTLEDLKVKISEADLQRIHLDMMTENRLRKFSSQEAWCDIILNI